MTALSPSYLTEDEKKLREIVQQINRAARTYKLVVKQIQDHNQFNNLCTQLKDAASVVALDFASEVRNSVPLF